MNNLIRKYAGYFTGHRPDREYAERMIRMLLEEVRHERD